MSPRLRDEELELHPGELPLLGPQLGESDEFPADANAAMVRAGDEHAELTLAAGDLLDPHGADEAAVHPGHRELAGADQRRHLSRAGSSGSVEPQSLLG